MSIQPRHFRIFLASPGDVPHERELALTVLDQLSYEPAFRGRITIEEVAWDKRGAGAPILANLTPQDSIEKGLPRPSDCDIVVVIFWARMGTPLPAQYKKKDGSRYLSGTEWEYENAMSASEIQGTPEVLLYRRTEPLLLNPEDSAFDEKTKQYRLVKTFFESLVNQDSSIKYGHNPYGSPSEFKELLEFHLKSIIERLLRESEKPSTIDRSILSPTWPKSPFPGLRAFTPEDAPIFFGRQRETDALIRKVEQNRVVAIVGASGSGKSSLVGAGLIPQLLLTTGNQGWVPISTTPDYLGNGDPFAALSAALLRDLSNITSKGLAASLLSDPESLAKTLIKALAKKQTDARILFFVDQFEELFTTVALRFRQRFVETMLRAASYDQVRIVITLRGDFYGRCVELPQLAKLLEDSTYPLSVPGIAALYEMITRPASRADLEFEEGLAQRILDDTGDEPGSLALMAYTLDELYRSSANSRQLTFTAYEELGGVQGAIGRRSESVFTGLNEKDQTALGHVFRELVKVDERGTATRRRESLLRVARSAEALRLVNALTDARLLVQSKGEDNEAYVEVAHEALLRSWERLAEWIKKTQDDLRLLSQVRTAANDWDLNGRRDDFLWSHERLEPVYAMRDHLQVEFDPVTLAFVRPEVDRLLEEFKSHSQYFRQRPLIERFAEIGESSIAALVDCLPYANAKSSRRDIHNVLIQHREPALQLLILGCSSNEAATRKAVTEELGRMREPATVGSLVGLLEDVDARVRINAVVALGHLEDSSTVKPIIKLLKDKSIAVRQVCVVELASFGNTEVLTALSKELSGTDNGIRHSCAQILGILGSKASEQSSRYYFFRGLISEMVTLPYDDYLYDSLEEALRRSEGKLIETIVSSPAMKAIIQCLSDDDDKVRGLAATTLGQIGSGFAVEPLSKLMSDKKSSVRERAITALGNIKDKKVVGALISGVSSKFPDVRVRSADLLGDLGSKTSSKPVKGLENVRDYVLESKAPDVLLVAIRNETIEVRRSAVKALGKIGAREAVVAISALLQDKDSELRANIVEALGSLGDTSQVPALVDALKDGALEVKTNAIRALGNFGDSNVLASIMAIPQPANPNYKEPELKLAIMETLGKIGDDSVISTLSDAIRDSDWRISQAAVHSLKHLKSPAANQVLSKHGYSVT